MAGQQIRTITTAHCGQRRTHPPELTGGWGDGTSFVSIRNSSLIRATSSGFSLILAIARRLSRTGALRVNRKEGRPIALLEQANPNTSGDDDQCCTSRARLRRLLSSWSRRGCSKPVAASAVTRQKGKQRQQAVGCEAHGARRRTQTTAPPPKCCLTGGPSERACRKHARAVRHAISHSAAPQKAQSVEAPSLEGKQQAGWHRVARQLWGG